MKSENDIVGYTVSGLPILRKVAREIHKVAPKFMNDPDVDPHCCGFTKEQVIRMNT